MSSFGTSHRQIVQDTNKGIELPTPREAAQSQARTGPKEVQRIGGPDFQGAQALINAAGTAAEPVIQESQRRAEMDAFTAAGTEEGKRAADAAADVWHNKLFGANASLRGAQERIAQDNARKMYLAAQDVLVNQGGDSWDDEKWGEWRDNFISDQVDKYESEGMKNLVNNSLAKDMQKLERDREYMHQQYVQAENYQTTLDSLSTIADSYNADLASGNPNRSLEDSEERLNEILALKESSGISDPAFARAVAHIAANEYSQNRDGFGKFAQEKGLVDELDFDDREALEQAQRVHEIKNDEEFGNRQAEIFGPRGYIAQGSVTKAMEAYDQLVADYPEAVPPGGRNQVRDQVRQQAWANQERARQQQIEIQAGKEMAATGNWAPIPQYDSFGNLTSFTTMSDTDKLIHTQRYIAEELENKFHANKKQQAELNGEVYERQPLSSLDRQQIYAENSAWVGQIMQQNGVMLPEVGQSASLAMSTIEHNLEDLDQSQQDQFLEQLNSLNSYYHGNASVRKMLSQNMGEENFAKLDWVHQQMNAGKTTQEIGRALAQGKGPAGGPATPPASVGAAAPGAVEHNPGNGNLREMRNDVIDNLGGEGIIWGRTQNKQDINALLTQYYSEALAAQGSTSQSAKDIAKSIAVQRVSNEGALISTGNGREFVIGAGQFEAEAQERGYESADHFLKELGRNPEFMREVRNASGESLTSWFGNPLTSNGASIQALPNGEVEIVIPRSGQEPYREVLEIPTEQHKSNVQIEDEARLEAAMAGVDNPEQWKELTGNDTTPRQELDASLNKQIISTRYPQMLGGKERKKLEDAVTQAERDAWMSADKYNAALIGRQQKAAEKAVRQTRRREVMPGFYHARRTRETIENFKNPSPKFVPQEPEIPFYRQGDDRTALQQKIDELKAQTAVDNAANRAAFFEGDQ